MIPFGRASRSKRADIAIDLGTANTIVVERGSGVVFDEPSVCCFKAYDAVPEFVAAGFEAQSYVGRAVRPFKVVRPLRNGVLSDMAAARELLRFATRAHRSAWRLSRPRAVIGVPADATEAERRALITAAVDAGLAEPALVAEPLLAAIGADLPIDEPRGRMLIDCGAGTTEVALMSLGAICYSHSVRGGGEALERALISHFALGHRFQIGVSTAERLKVQLSELLQLGRGASLVEVRGLDTASGIPKTITVAAQELWTAWERYIGEVVTIVQTALAEAPPEMSHDILEDGISLTGGAAMTALLADRIEAVSGIRSKVVDQPMRSVATGLLQLIRE